MEFHRPQTLFYPQIYKVFTSNNEEFYVADLTEEDTREALNLLTKFVIPEENFCKAIQIHTKPNAVKVMMENYQKLIAKKTSLGCFKKESGELVGLNILAVKTRGEKIELKNDDIDLKVLRETSTFTSSLYNVFDHFPIDHYLHAFGLGVKTDYRRKNIAVELLKARIPLLISLGLSLTFTSFSTLNSQKTAIKAGYKEVFTISYEKLQKEFPHFDFSKATGSDCKDFVLEV